MTAVWLRPCQPLVTVWSGAHWLSRLLGGSVPFPSPSPVGFSEFPHFKKQRQHELPIPKALVAL